MNWAIQRILLVDDDTTFRERLALSFRRREYIVQTACNAKEALEACELHDFDAAIIDLRMPEVDGLSLLDALLQRRPKLRVLMLTGYGSIATAIDAIQRGAHNYLTKPVDAERIEEALLSNSNRMEEPALTARVPVPSLDRVEWEHIQRVLKDCDGNVSQAARALGIERRSLQRKLKKYPPSA